jgi:putative flippase GtrA
MAGGAAAGTNLLLLYIFHGIFGLWIVLSTSLAFAVAFFVSFFLQKFWTFRDNEREQIVRQMSLYLAVGLTNLAINAVAMYLLVEILQVWYMLAQVVVGALIASESFLIYKLLIFRKANA